MLPIQLDMALAALGWGTRDLASAAGVSLDTIGRFKRGERIKDATLATMRTTLEAAGVIFIARNGEGAGIRLNKPREFMRDIANIARQKGSGHDGKLAAKERLDAYKTEVDKYYRTDTTANERAQYYMSELRDRIGHELNNTASNSYADLLDYVCTIYRDC